MDLHAALDDRPKCFGPAREGREDADDQLTRDEGDGQAQEATARLASQARGLTPEIAAVARS